MMTKILIGKSGGQEAKLSTLINPSMDFTGTRPDLTKLFTGTRMTREMGNIISSSSRMPRILLSSDYSKPMTRQALIEKFLAKGWLTEKQEDGMKPWIRDMLNEFAIEILLHAKNGGIDQLLSEINLPQKRPSVIPLKIISSPPVKPTKSTIAINEIDGDLLGGEKTVKLQDVVLKNPNEDDHYGCC
jgi:hypothetical protein